MVDDNAANVESFTENFSHKIRMSSKDDVAAPPAAADVVDSAAATNNTHISEEKKTDDGAADSGGGILPDMTLTSDGFPSKAPLGSFEDSNVDDTPYEHGFQPGDHVIRWDMLPILWPIQIHGIVLEVSEDKTTVTICDFGITTVKNDVVGKKIAKSGGEEKDVEKMLEEENAKFNEAINDEGERGGSSSDTNNASAAGEEKKGGSKNRLNIVVLTKWSDLRKWKKVNYEGGGLLNIGGGMGKGLEKLGKQTEKLWTSVTKSFVVRKESTESKKVVHHHVPSVRHDVNDEGYCVHHPEIQLQRRLDEKGHDGQDAWSIVRKKCPECILEDCPAMMGDESPASRTSTTESTATFSSVDEDEHREESKEEGEKTDAAAASNLSDGDSIQAPSSLHHARAAGGSSSADNHDVFSPDVSKTDSKDAMEEPKTLSQMIAEANAIDKRTVRKTVVKTAPTLPVKEQSLLDKRSSWRQGSFMKSVSGLFSLQKNEKDEESLNNKEESASPSKAKEGTNKSKEANELPRSDPAVLVLARTRFILEHGEEILPPYHIINSNSECIAVW